LDDDSLLILFLPQSILSFTTIISSTAALASDCDIRLRLPSLSPARPDSTLDHVSDTGKGTGETCRVDFLGTPEHGGSAERQCRACACRRWWRTIVHGPDVCAMETNRCGLLTTPQLSAHYPLYPRPSRIKACSVVDAQCSAPHHQARGCRWTLCRSRFGPLRHQRYELRILLLYGTSTSVRYNDGTDCIKGTNGLAPSSKRLRSKPVAPRPSSPRSNP
jgi:hypothetical protein